VKIAVAGGTGTVGRYVVEAAERAGHDVITLSRSTGVDLLTGVVLDTALEDVEVIIGTISGRLSASQEGKWRRCPIPMRRHP